MIMTEKDKDFLMEVFTKMLPDLKDIKVSIDDITGKTTYVGTNADGAKVRFEVIVKVTQISKIPKVVA